VVEPSEELLVLEKVLTSLRSSSVHFFRELADLETKRIKADIVSHPLMQRRDIIRRDMRVYTARFEADIIPVFHLFFERCIVLKILSEIILSDIETSTSPCLIGRCVTDIGIAVERDIQPKAFYSAYQVLPVDEKGRRVLKLDFHNPSTSLCQLTDPLGDLGRYISGNIHPRSVPDLIVELIKIRAFISAKIKVLFQFVQQETHSSST
jgi:hypothetical protein